MYEAPSLEMREEMARIDLKAARLWLGPKRDEPAASSWAATCLWNAALGYVCVGVRRYEAATELRAYLESHCLAELVGDALALMRSADELEVFTGLDPGLVYGAWLLGRRDLAAGVLDRTSKVIGHGAASRLWQDYHLALVSLARRSQFRRSFSGAPRGSQRLWCLHLDLIEAVTCGQDPAQAISAARKEFERQNQDRRLNVVIVSSIFPSGLDPVRFDLSIWAILELARAARPE